MLKRLKSEVARSAVAMVYVARRDGAIYGIWTNPSAEATVVLPVDHPDVVAFLRPPVPPVLTLEQKLARIGLTAAELKQLLS